MNTKQVVLRDSEIRITLKRMVLQIAENYVDVSDLLLIGLNERGSFLAKLIQTGLTETLPNLQVLFQQMDIKVDMPARDFGAQHILIVDDVLNSGKTAFIAAMSCMNANIKTMETAFLAVREHRSFPISANYVGLSIATTLQDHVLFDNENADDLNVYLQ
jgi:pyrimidine operon attenuation protein / uracil phosphoribosyltransferase